MKQIYSGDDIVRFLYDEMDEEEYELFFAELCKNKELWSLYDELKSSKESLSPVEENPSPVSLEKIMYHARKSVIHTSGESLRNTHKKSRSLFNFSLTRMTVVLMLFFSMTGSAAAFYFYHNTPSDPPVASANTDWNQQLFQERIMEVKTNLRHTTEDRFVPLPMYNNTYRMVSHTASWQPQSVKLIQIK